MKRIRYAGDMYFRECALSIVFFTLPLFLVVPSPRSTFVLALLVSKLISNAARDKEQYGVSGK